MNYKEQLLKEHSRKNTDSIAKAIGSDANEFRKIMDIIYYSEKPPLPQRASWVLAVVNKKHPELLIPHISLFINSIKLFDIDGIKRNLMLVLASHLIPKKYQAKLLNICFEFILSPTETVVVKVHAMQIIANLSKEHPDIKGELKSVIEDQLPKSTAAFRARAKRILKEMKQ